MRSVERRLYAVAAMLVASGVLHLAVFALGNRPWDGPVSWRKPATFGLSFGVTLASVVWVTARLRMGSRMRSAALVVFGADCVLEVAGITVQAWRDRPSHLNTSTPTDAAIAYTLALGGAVLIVTLGLFAVVAFRGAVDGPASVLLAYRAGFALLMAALAAGAAMIAVGTVAMRTGPAANAYQVTGFLKGFHAVSLHAVLVLPALARLLETATSDEPLRRRIIRAAVTGYLVAALCILAVELLT